MRAELEEITMEDRKNQVLLFFQDRMEGCQAKGAQLNQQERRDEADFQKIRENIYDIFLKMFQFSLQTTGELDAAKVAAVFYQKLDTIPANWKISYQKAKEHGDEAKAYIEEIKLEVVEEIRSGFHRIWEEET